MAEFNVRSDSVNVEHVMEQIRARIREKRGVDYTEAQIQELANVRLEKFLDPHNVKSDLVREFVRMRAELDTPASLNESVDESALFETHRPWLRVVRGILRPLLKLSINTKALAALSELARGEVERRSRDRLNFELMHNMVVEMTRLGIQVRNLTMLVESTQSRLEFNERRARALESAVVYKPSEAEPAEPPARPPMREMRDTRPPPEYRPRPDPPPAPSPSSSLQSPSPSIAGAPASGAPAPDGQGQRSRRRRRRRGRRGGGLGAQQPGEPAPSGDSAPPQHEAATGESLSSAHDTDDSGPDTDPDPQ